MKKNALGLCVILLFTFGCGSDMKYKELAVEPPQLPAFFPKEIGLKVLPPPPDAPLFSLPTNAFLEPSLKKRQSGLLVYAPRDADRIAERVAGFLLEKAGVRPVAPKDAADKTPTLVIGVVDCYVDTDVVLVFRAVLLDRDGREIATGLVAHRKAYAVPAAHLYTMPWYRYGSIPLGPDSIMRFRARLSRESVVAISKLLSGMKKT